MGLASRSCDVKFITSFTVYKYGLWQKKTLQFWSKYAFKKNLVYIYTLHTETELRFSCFIGPSRPFDPTFGLEMAIQCNAMSLLMTFLQTNQNLFCRKWNRTQITLSGCVYWIFLDSITIILFLSLYWWCIDHLQVYYSSQWSRFLYH